MSWLLFNVPSKFSYKIPIMVREICVQVSESQGTFCQMFGGNSDFMDSVAIEFKIVGRGMGFDF